MERPNSRQKETAAQVAPEEDDAGQTRAPAKRQATPEEAEAGRPQALARRQAPAATTTDRVRDPAKGKCLEEVPPTEKEKEKEKKKKKRSSVEEFELWEIGTSGPALDLPAEEEPIRLKKRRLQRPASREDGTTTIAVDRFPTKGPPTRTMVRIVPRGANATGGHATATTTTSDRGGGSYGGGADHDGGSGGRGRTGGGGNSAGSKGAADNGGRGNSARSRGEAGVGARGRTSGGTEQHPGSYLEFGRKNSDRISSMGCGYTADRCRGSR
jgi:hypothetical protein